MKKRGRKPENYSVTKLAKHIGISKQALSAKIQKRRKNLDCEMVLVDGDLLIEFYADIYNEIYTVNFKIENIEYLQIKEACYKLARKAIGLFIAFDLNLISWGQKYDFEMPINELESNYMIVPIQFLTESEKKVIDDCIQENKQLLFKILK